MSGKKPQTILTDEDAAMAKAIKIVLQGTHHRICVWHMNQNACKHLAGVVEDYKKFNVEFQKCIYDQEEEEDFINAWNQLLSCLPHSTFKGINGFNDFLINDICGH
jgi:zinc finger SWIM domain-containing protein 3